LPSIFFTWPNLWRNRRGLSRLAPKKVAATRGSVITSAVDIGDLQVVTVADGFQEVVAQAVDGGYGIASIVVLLVREGWWPSDREDIRYRGRGQLGLGY
jgi:hypothetical protein